MLKQIRQEIVGKLWSDYFASNDHARRIAAGMHENCWQPVLDHFAVIDLPGPNTGIPELRRILSAVGYVYQGSDYLPEKQNDFIWMAEEDSIGMPAASVLPQIVAADFRLDEMPRDIRDTVLKYSSQSPASPAQMIETLGARAAENDVHAAQQLKKLIAAYFLGRDWPMPTVRDFEVMHEFNELIAWVMIFGRKPNHFTLSIPLMPGFDCLADFHHFVETKTGLPLNHDGGVIKGKPSVGIEQGSTAGTPCKIHLADGMVELPLGFVEFVWRFPVKQQALLWNDYFTGFIGNHANRVIQSLYTGD
jgi:hypothetical protein